MKKNSNSIAFGKGVEHIVFGKLIQNGFDVYTPIVDDKQIDCIVRLDSRRSIDVQIKARSKTAKARRHFTTSEKFKPRASYYFIFYTGEDESFWVIPSKELTNLGNQYDDGSVGINFPCSPKSTKAKIKQFAPYKNEEGFTRLRAFKL